MEGLNLNLSIYLYVYKPRKLMYVSYKAVLIWSFQSRIQNKSTGCANQEPHVIS